MKAFLVFFVTAALFFMGCSNCTWVVTGYHYDDEDNYVEDGYYDCPDENPVEPAASEPILNIIFGSKSNDYFNKSNHDCSVTVNNSGEGNANNVKCSVTITRPSVNDNSTIKIFESERDLGQITPYWKNGFTFGFSDISYSGSFLYIVSVTATYTDDNGISGSVSQNFEM